MNEIPISVWLFLAGNLLTVIGTGIKLYVDHVRLKDRVIAMEKNCKTCKSESDHNVREKTDDLKHDIEEMKTEFKELRKDFQDFRVSMTDSFRELKTIISGMHP
jgi:archaellum component FlaC